MNSPGEEIHRVRSRGFPNAGASVPTELGYTTLPGQGALTNPEAPKTP